MNLKINDIVIISNSSKSFI